MERLNELLLQYKWQVLLILVGLVLVVGGLKLSNLGHSASGGSKSFPKASIVDSNKVESQIKIDISGAVSTPGVYSLPTDSRIEDAVKIAGGFSTSADGEFINKQLNLSQKISDGQKIYIPFTGEKFTQASSGQVAGASTTGKIGINSASESELDKLPGVGPVTAQKIISLRPYQDISDLINKKAVSKSVFEKIKDMVDMN